MSLVRWSWRGFVYAVISVFGLKEQKDVVEVVGVYKRGWREEFEEILHAEKPLEKFKEHVNKMDERASALLKNLRMTLRKVDDEKKREAILLGVLLRWKTIAENAEVFKGMAQLYEKAREVLSGTAVQWSEEDAERLRELIEKQRRILDEFRRALNELELKYNNPHLRVDEKQARELAEATYHKFSKYSGATIGTKLYASLLVLGKRNAFALIVKRLDEAGMFGELLRVSPLQAYKIARKTSPDRLPRGDEEYKISRLAVYLSKLGELTKLDKPAMIMLKNKEGSRVEIVVMTREGVIELKTSKDKATFTLTGALRDRQLNKFLEEATRYKSEPPSAEWLLEEALGLMATDASLERGRIKATTNKPRQFAWYVRVFGEPEDVRLSRANITDEEISLDVEGVWPDKRLDNIIAKSKVVKMLFGDVETWRDLVNAIDWDWVVRTVEELRGELMKPSVEVRVAGKKSKDKKTLRPVVDAELFEKAFSSLKLYADFMKARRISWAKAVEVLSGGRIQGKYAEWLAAMVEEYAEGRLTKKEMESAVSQLARQVVVDGKLAEFIVDVLAKEVLFRITRKFAASVYMLKLAEAAEQGMISREEALHRIGRTYAAMIAGDGSIKLPSEIYLAVGGVFSDAVALLVAAALYKAGRLAPEKFKPYIYKVKETEKYHIKVSGNHGRALGRLLATAAPSVGGEYLLEKFNALTEFAKLKVEVGNVERTEDGTFKTTLTLRLQRQSVTFNVYFADFIRLAYKAADRMRLELAARLLKLAGVKKVEISGGRIQLHADALASANEELRRELLKTIAQIEEKIKSGGAEDAEKWRERIEHWRRKLEASVAISEEFPKYSVRPSGIFFESTNPDSIRREAERLMRLGLREGVHFTVKMPSGGEEGYIYVTASMREPIDGVKELARLSVHAEDPQIRDEARRFLEHLLARAIGEMREKLERLIEEGRRYGSTALKGLKREGVEVLDGRSWVGEDGKLYIYIDAVADGVKESFTIAYRLEGGERVGYIYVKSAEVRARVAKIVEALTGKRPGVIKGVSVKCRVAHLQGFMEYKELYDAIAQWLDKARK